MDDNTLYSIGVSHKNTPLEIRGRFAFSDDGREVFICSLLKLPAVASAVLLATCNRTEVYFTGKEGALASVEAALAAKAGMTRAEAIRLYNVYSGEDAVKHIFNVAAGVDSLLAGEDEILGQVKEAFALSLKLKATDFTLNTVFKGAITYAKRSKTDTAVSRTPISYATLAANEVFSLEGSKKTLIIGISGKLGSSIAKNLLCGRNVDIVGTTRRSGGLYMDERIRLAPYSDRYKWADWADVIISATKSPHYTLTAADYAQSDISAKPRLFIDVAAPGDIDPDIGKADGARLIGEKYFSELAHRNAGIRFGELREVSEIAREGAENAIKELVFHELYKSLPDLEKYFDETPFRDIIYSIRKTADKDELAAIWRVLKRVVRGEG